MKNRYEAKRSGIYDHQRGCHILKQLSPSAVYNEAVAARVVKVMNAYEEALDAWQDEGEDAAHKILIDTFNELNY